MKLRGKPGLHVKVMSPTQTFYDGSALSVSAANQVGPFDILENHINFFSLLVTGTITINTGERTIEIPVTHGILKVSNNTVTFFIDIVPATSQKSA